MSASPTSTTVPASATAAPSSVSSTSAATAIHTLQTAASPFRVRKAIMFV